jgi:hypothetical protein
MECRVKTVLIFFLALGTVQASNYFVTVAGLGGTPEYETQFKQWAASMDKALRANGADCHVETLTGAAATRRGIRETLGRIAGEIKPDDAFALLMIGHGTYDGAEYKFNIPGPDITAEELVSLLNRISAGRQLVVNMTSASGASLPLLAKKNRVVITATKSGTEKNATVFARYWLDALQNAAADTDKNGTVSALEAFRFAQGKTAAYFQQEKLLATEHAMLDDTGAKSGVRDPAPANAQGLLAAAFPVIRPPAEAAAAQKPGKQKLLAKKEQLEAAIDRLKYEKAAMPAEDYKKQLSTLLLQLAQTQQEIDQ